MFCDMSTDLQDYCSTCECVFDVRYIVLNNILEYVMCIEFGIREKTMPGILSSTVYGAMQVALRCFYKPEPEFY